MHSAMEQTKYWMWTRRKFGERPLLNSPNPTIAAGSSYNESWEEQAFAEDSAGHLGGCVWPPRSYSCSFCRREFRSAQALGGHMNVHRRDRARLKQVSSPISENQDQADHRHQLDPCTLLGTQYSTMVYNPNLNPNPNPSHGVVASTISPSRVSAAWTQENCSEDNLVSPCYPSSVTQEQVKESIFSTTRSLADSIPSQQLTVLELKLGRENWTLREVGCRRPRDVSDDDEETISRKRRKTDPMIALFANPSSDDKKLLQTEVIKLKPSPVEELDLELRLGDPPKVK